MSAPAGRLGAYAIRARHVEDATRRRNGAKVAPGAVPRTLGSMSLAELDRSASLGSRLGWVVLLCAVALGIVGMHGLVSSTDGPEPAGHHVAQAVDVAPVPASPGTAEAADDTSPAVQSGLLALCVMMLVPGAALALWLLVRSRAAGWRLRRVVVRTLLAADVATPPQPFWRQLTVLRI